MPNAADALALQLVLSDLSTEVIADLVALWRQYSDDPDFAALLLAAFPEIIGPYTQAGAMVSAQWYTEQAPDLPYVATPYVDLPAERLDRSVRWALYAPVEMRVPEDFIPQEPVAVKVAPSPDLVLSRLAGSVKRMVYDASRQTVLHNLQAEYGDIGGGGSFEDEPGTRWARYASANACSFCRLMATRGAVYRSRESAEGVTGRSIDITTADRRHIAAGLTTRDEALARRARYSNARAASKAGRTVGDRKTGRLRGSRGYGGKYHDHCRCIAVPVRPGTSYEPPSYVEKWEDDYIAATRAVSAAGQDTGGKGELNAILREMDAIDSRRREGQAADPIEMVGIEVYGRDGAPKPMRVPADSPAARAYAKSQTREELRPPTAGGSGGGDDGGRGGGGGRGGLADPDDDGWLKIIDHAWERHAPDAIKVGHLGTKLPDGTTREQLDEVRRDILARQRLTAAPGGRLADALIAQLDAGEVALEEQRERFVNVFARVGNVRYQIRLAGKKSTMHPIDGEGVVRHSKKDGEIIETAMPLGARPVNGWDEVPADAVES